MLSPSQVFRSLIAQNSPFIVGDCYSAVTARVVQHVGFEAAYMGGHATGINHYAIPDLGVLTPTEMIDQAGRVAEAISIPLIVDADQAGEAVGDVYRTIRRFQRVGVAGVHIEDNLTPKHTTFDSPLMSIKDMQARIGAAVDAKVDPDFVLIARSDEFHTVVGAGGGSLEETIRRGIAYAEAGADVFLPTSAPDEVVARIAAEVPIPTAIFGPLVNGAAFSLYTGWGAASAVRAHYQWASHLREYGVLPAEAFEMPEKDELIDQAIYDAIVTTWAERTGRPTRPRLRSE